MAVIARSLQEDEFYQNLAGSFVRPWHEAVDELSPTDEDIELVNERIIDALTVQQLEDLFAANNVSVTKSAQIYDYIDVSQVISASGQVLNTEPVYTKAIEEHPGEPMYENAIPLSMLTLSMGVAYTVNAVLHLSAVPSNGTVEPAQTVPEPTLDEMAALLGTTGQLFGTAYTITGSDGTWLSGGYEQYTDGISITLPPASSTSADLEIRVWFFREPQRSVTGVPIKLYVPAPAGGWTWQINTASTFLTNGAQLVLSVEAAT